MPETADAPSPDPRVTLLDGLRPGPLADGLSAALVAAGMHGPTHHLGDERFAPCQGCWNCWVGTLGVCKINDAANGVMADTIGADAVLWTTPLCFGAWGPLAKAALDRSIGLVSPFFRTVGGETHHQRRYRRYPRWAVIAALGPDDTAEDAALFRRLVSRNTINMLGRGPAHVGFVPSEAGPAAIRGAAQAALDALRQAGDDDAPFVPQAPCAPRPDAVGPGPGRHVTLWVGSAKPLEHSTSASLGAALVARLEARGWTSETVRVSQAVRLGRRSAPKLRAAVERADLLVLASPVYVDALPALVLQGLDALAAAPLAKRPAVLPIVQCGFPEVQHTALALEIVSRAAGRLGLPWAGHLAMGAGAMIDGRPLEAAGAQLQPQRDAIDRAAEALAAGQPVPAEATAAFAKLMVPDGLYRVIGNVGWLAQAVGQRSLTRLWSRPFDEAPG